ncbi:MAG TPA: sugar phosphate nucleotidyltransferase, partial [Candidatus Obscuribacterales bacterium]
MKSVILAGGLGTRISEETIAKPKPMVEIGGKPILWHIMNIYAKYNVADFFVALGYKGELIKDYFLNFYTLNNNISVDLATGTTTIHEGKQPNWKIHLVDTGLNTQTGGRIKRLKDWLGEDTTFMLTYGDGVANINIEDLLAFHQRHGKLATVTAVRPPARFGEMSLDGDRVTKFVEKSQAS